MRDPTDDAPNPDQLAEELRALHERRSREPLTPEEEARFAELWAWWQAGGDAGVPNEWLEAFSGGAEAAPLLDESDTAGDLAQEWEAWEAQRPAGDPFDLMPPDDPGTGSYEEVMAARAAVLADGVDAGAVDEPFAVPDLAAEPPPVEPPPVEPAPEPPGEAMAPAVRVEGRQRVVIHLADGQSRRGQVASLDLGAPAFELVASGGAAESVARGDVRTLFVMRAPGTPADAPAAGQLIAVTLRDGREISGTSADHASGGDALTLVPDPARSGAALVWIARSAVRSINVVA